MTTACNWVNRVRRTEAAIVSDGAWLGGRVESVENGQVLPITGHRMLDHTYTAEYELAVYVWDRDGNGTRRAR